MPSSKLRQAILLADIFGQEMEPLYNNIPTLLLPIGNIPMIEILLHHLYVSKIEQLTVIYSKNSYQIKQYIDKTRYGRIQRELTHDVCLCGQMCEHSHHILDEEQKLQIKYIDTHHQTPVNMLSQYLQDYDNDLDATFLVINGPTIFNFNLQEFYKQHVQHENNNYLATMAIQEIPEQGYMNSINAPYLIHYSKEQVLLNLQKFQNDDEILLNLVQYGVESTITTQCQPTEVYIFSKSMIPLIIEGKQKQSEHIFEIIQNQLNSSNEQQIGIYDIKNLKSGRVDCPRTYKSLNLMFIHNQFYPYTPQFNIFWKNGKRVNQQKFGLALIGNNLQLQGKLEGRSFIGSQCEISGRVVNSILGDNVKILPGADVIQSIILDNVTIGQNCYISDSIILRNTHIQNNVMLPPGSIIGSDIYQLENRTILNAIRCFTQTIWGLDQIVSHLSTQNIIYSDISLFKMFIFGQSLSIPISIIKTLPPIYIQEQFATQIALNRYQEICLFYEELHETPQNSCYENELQFIEISIQRLKNEADIENLYDDYEISNETDVDNLKNNTQQYSITTDQDETCGDSQSPSKLAQYINNVNQTDVITKYWIPQLLIKNAQNSTNIEQLKIELLDSQFKNGFSFQPKLTVKEHPYLELTNQFDFLLENQNNHIQDQVIYSKYGIRHYESLSTTDKQHTHIFQEIQEMSNWNVIAQMLVKVLDNHFIQQYYLEDLQSSDIFYEIKELCLNFCQNLQFTYITLKHKQDFDLAPTVLQILLILALQSTEFTEFNSQNQAKQGYKTDSLILARLTGLLQFLTYDSKRFGAVSPLNSTFDPEDLIIQICLIMHYYIFKSNILESKDKLEDGEADEAEQQLCLDILVIFIDKNFITKNQVLEWANNQGEIFESYKGMEYDELEDEDIVEIEFYQFIASYVLEQWAEE